MDVLDVLERHDDVDTRNHDRSTINNKLRLHDEKNALNVLDVLQNAIEDAFDDTLFGQRRASRLDAWSEQPRQFSAPTPRPARDCSKVLHGPVFQALRRVVGLQPPSRSDFHQARASCWIRNPARFPSRDADRFAFCNSHRELTFEIFN